MIPAPLVLDSLRRVGDPLADEVVSQLFGRKLIADANALFGLLTRNDGIPDQPQPVKALLEDFLHLTAELPAFADEAQLARGAQFFQDHGPQILTVLGAYSLPLDYAAKNGVQVLARTARMTGNPNRRIVETAQMLSEVLSPGGLSNTGGGIRAIQKVRLIHAAVRYLIHSYDRTWRPEYGTPINQEDMVGTMLSFSVAVIEGLRRLGMEPAAADAEAYFHSFRVLGYLMGISSQVLPESLAEARELALLIGKRQLGESSEGRELTRALVRLMDEAYPWPLKGMGPALMRFLLGEELADQLAVPKTSWGEQQILRIQQRFYISAESAANQYSFFAALRHTISHWYLTHLEMIDRGSGRPQLQIPETLRAAWRTSGEAKSPPGPPAGAAKPLRPLPRPVGLRFIPHPVDRNHRITQSYHELSEAMGDLLGAPRVADWCTFAKFASRQAGHHIRETSLTSSQLLSAFFDRKADGKLLRIIDDMRQIPARLSMAGRLLTLCLKRCSHSLDLGDVRRSSGPRVITAIGDFRAAAARLNRAFFLGNLRVYENIAPAYHTFLRVAYSDYPNIPDAALSFDAEVDPMGYLQRGLCCYRDALRCSRAGDISTRDERVREGNLWLGLHEQGCVLQPLFDEVREELKVLSDGIVVNDPRGMTRMLPRGGDWGDFYDRMGIDPSKVGNQPWTSLPPLRSAAERAGTIAAYFDDGLRAESLMATRPTDILPMFKAAEDDLLEEERYLE